MKRHPMILAVALAGLLLAGCGTKEPEPAVETPDGPMIHAKRVAEAGPVLVPGASAFAGAAELEVALLPQLVVAPYNATVSVDTVRVRAVHDGQWLSVQLEWRDTTRDDKPGIGDFEDMVAIQIPRAAGAMPNPMMGDANNEVVLFQWRAGVQAALDRGERPDVKHAYPYTHKDIDIADLLGDEAGAPYRGAAGIGNPLALGSLEISPVFAMVAAGYSTVTVWPERLAEGRGKHANGRWRVALHIPLNHEAAASLQPGAEGLMSFAAWDGAHRETGSRKAWSPAWTPIRLEP
jgi:hypothetical protein